MFSRIVFLPAPPARFAYRSSRDDVGVLEGWMRGSFVNNAGKVYPADVIDGGVGDGRKHGLPFLCHAESVRGTESANGIFMPLRHTRVFESVFRLGIGCRSRVLNREVF